MKMKAIDVYAEAWVDGIRRLRYAQVRRKRDVRPMRGAL